MAQALAKPVRVRAWLYCSMESFALLAELGNRWLDCPAAHQSNIVREVKQLAHDAQRRAPADYLKHRTDWAAASRDDSDRLRSVIGDWPQLTHRQQAAIVEQIQTVVGR